MQGYGPIKFLRTSQFNSGYTVVNTGWNNLDAAIDAEEEGMRWDKHRAVVFTSEVVTSIASALVRDTVDTDILIAQKWANLEDLKSKITGERLLYMYLYLYLYRSRL
jgi:hypothetical protein